MLSFLMQATQTGLDLKILSLQALETSVGKCSETPTQHDCSVSIAPVMRSDVSTKRKQSRRRHEMPCLPRFWKILQSLKIKKQPKHVYLLPAFVRTESRSVCLLHASVEMKLKVFIDFLWVHCTYMTSSGTQGPPHPGNVESSNSSKF